MSLRLYFQPLLILRTVLDLEIQILAKTKFMGTTGIFNTLSNIYDKVF